MSPSSVQMGEGSFKTDGSKPTCDTDKVAFLQGAIPESQELVNLRNEVKVRTDLYEEMKDELKKQTE